MYERLEGRLSAEGARFGIVVSRFNDFITRQLLDGAVRTFARHGIPEEHLVVAWCPGSFEIPVVARKLAARDDLDAVICLGAVIRGATAHFDYVAGPAASGVARVGLDAGKPVIFGIITTETIEQAIERAGTKMGNKGAEAAEAAIEMVNLFRQL